MANSYITYLADEVSRIDRGRLNRMDYLFLSLTVPLLIFIALSASAGLLVRLFPATTPFAYIIIAVAIGLALYALFIQTSKRVHDFGLSSLYAVLAILPPIYLLYCVIPGQAKNNEYGPKQSASDDLIVSGVIIVATLLLIFIGFKSLGFLTALPI